MLHIAPRLVAAALALAGTAVLLSYQNQISIPLAHASEEIRRAPAADVRAAESENLRVAVFAGGCFWGVEGVFSHVRGVRSAVAGYHGGSESSARYTMVAYGRTDHAESVRIVYDPAQVRYDELLRIYFSVVADPTQLNRQGPDSGRHYRSAIVPMNREQSRVARAYIAQLEAANIWSRPIVTAIEAYSGFYEAEDYHQDFMFENPTHPYIVRWDRPKVEGLRTLYPDLYRAAPLRDS